MKNITRQVFIALLFISPLTLSAHENNELYGQHMMWQGHGMLFGPFMMLIFVAAIILIAIAIVRLLGGHNAGSQVKSGKEAIDILKLRFANGEIDEKEFEERMRLLK